MPVASTWHLSWLLEEIQHGASGDDAAGAYAMLFLPVRGDRRRAYLFGGVAAVTIVVGAILSLYIWIASRQVRPRKTPSSPSELPTSPTSKRLRRNSFSFEDMHALEKELLEETVRFDHRNDDDSLAFPLMLQRTCTREQLKWIYDTLSKVYSFLRGEYMEPLTQ